MLSSPVLPMHIPDGFLSVVVAAICWILSIGVISIALRRVGRDLSDHQVPLMGVLAAGIFAGQLLNFSVAGGTSGHLLGAALSTIILGPWAGMVVLTTVVSLQALIFQDGGLLALGANIFNMAVVGVAVSHFAYRSLRGLLRGRLGILIGGAAAAWLSTVAASLACALELALSGTTPANLVIPAMGGIHALIGLGEAGITAGALSFLYAARRDILSPQASAPRGSMSVWIAGGFLAALLAILSPLASRDPDGLMRVAEQQGFLQNAQNPLYRLIPNYAIAGFDNGPVATIVAALIGVSLVLVTVLIVAFLGRPTEPVIHREE